jgi:hypothetical protein
MKLKTIVVTSNHDPGGFGCQISWYENIIYIEGFNVNSVLKSNGAMIGDIIINVSNSMTNEVINGSNFDDLSAFTAALGKLPRPVTFELVEPDSHTNGINAIITSPIALNSLFTYIKANYFEKKDTDFYVNLINLFIDCDLTDDFELLRAVYDELFTYFHDVHSLQEEKVRDKDYLKLQIKFELQKLLINYQNSNKSHFVNVLEYIASKNNVFTKTKISNISLKDMLSTKNLLFLYASIVSTSKGNIPAIHTSLKQLLDDRNNTLNITSILKYVPTFRTTVEYDLLVNATPIKKLFSIVCYHNFYVHYCIKINNSKINDTMMYVFPLDTRKCKAILITDSTKNETEQSGVTTGAQCDDIFDYLVDNHCKQADPPVELKINTDNHAMRTVHSYYFRHNGEAYYGCTYSYWRNEIVKMATPSHDILIQEDVECNASTASVAVKTRNAVELYRSLKNKTIELLKNIKSSTNILQLSHTENESITTTATTFESLSSTASVDFESTCPDATSKIAVEGFSLLTNIPTITKLRHFVVQNTCKIESALKGEDYEDLTALTKLDFGAEIHKEIDIDDINTKLFRHLDPIIFLHIVYACLTESKILVIASSNTAILSLGEYLRQVLFKPFELTFGLYIPTFPMDCDISSYLDMPSSYFIGVNHKNSVQKILKMQKLDGILIIDMVTHLLTYLLTHSLTHSLTHFYRTVIV